MVTPDGDGEMIAPGLEEATAGGPARPDARQVLRRLRKRARISLAAALSELQENPASPESAARAARLHLQSGSCSAAIKLIEDCVAAGGSRKILYREAGWLRLQAGLYREAADDFAQSLGAKSSGGAAALGKAQAIDGLARDAAVGVTPEDRSRYVAGIEHLVMGRPDAAEPLLRRVASEHPGFLPAWLGWRGALEALGRPAQVQEVAADLARAPPDRKAAIGTAMTRPLGPRGLAFDPREPIPIRAAGESLAEVGEPGALHAGEDSILVLERGGAEVEIEPVIPLAATGPQQTRFSYRRGGRFVAAIEGAAVIGRGLVLNRAGEFLEETDPPSSLEKADFARVGGHLITDPLNFQDGACPVRIFDEPALLMTFPTDTSFGDWMLKAPDRLAIAAEIGLDCPLLLREGTDDRFIQILGALGWDTRRILFHDPRGVSLLPRLYTTSWPLHRWNTPMSDLLGIFRRAPAPRRAPPSAGERIYLSREGAPKRRLVNEAEIRSLFERRGFRAVKPEALGFQETRDLFANADIVAGPYGSAFLNVVHSPQPPVALVLMPPAPERYLHEIALWLASSGSQFAYVRGDGSPGRKKTDPWSVPAEKVEAALDELLDLQSRRAGRSA